MGFGFLVNVGIVSMAQLFAGFFGFVFTLLAARWLGPESYGLFQAMMGLYGLFSMFYISLFLSTMHCVGVSAESDRARVVGEFLRVGALFSIPVVLFLFVAAGPLAESFRSPSRVVIYVLGPFFFFTTMARACYGKLQGQQHFLQFSLSRVAESFTVIVFGSLFLWLGWGPQGAVGGYVVAMALVTCFWLSRPGFFEWGSKWNSVRREWHSISRILAVLGVVIFADSFPMIYVRMNLSDQDSGYFAALYNSRNIVMPFVFAVVFPFYSQLVSKQKEDYMLRKALAICTLIGGGFLIVGAFFARPFITAFYGAKYGPASVYMLEYGLFLILLMYLLVVCFYQLSRKKLNWIPLIVLIPFLVFCCLRFGNSIDGVILSQIRACALTLAVFLLEIFWSRRRARKVNL